MEWSAGPRSTGAEVAMAHVMSPSPFGERFAQERSLDGPHLSFDLGVEVDRLKHEAPWRERGHNAITLAKYPDLRFVVMVLKAGARMTTHEPDERVSLQVLTGKLRVRAGGRDLELAQGHLLAMDRAQAHEVEALEESSFLLTLSWPTGAKA
jgi:quercetin dioxygenase-like cupin family protein